MANALAIIQVQRLNVPVVIIGYMIYVNVDFM